METVREAAQSNDFSLHDQHNIIKFTGERQSQLDRNRNNITKRNQERAANYANERQELQGFDLVRLISSFIFLLYKYTVY